MVDFGNENFYHNSASPHILTFPRTPFPSVYTINSLPACLPSCHGTVKAQCGVLRIREATSESTDTSKQADKVSQPIAEVELPTTSSSEATGET